MFSHFSGYLKDTGSLMQQRRLEKEPACIATYQGGVGGGHNFVLAHRDSTLQVYVNFQLVWAVTVCVFTLIFFRNNIPMLNDHIRLDSNHSCTNWRL